MHSCSKDGPIRQCSSRVASCVFYVCVQARAAIDLDCQPQAISAELLVDQTGIANGCGKQAVYVETCAGNNRATVP